MPHSIYKNEIIELYKKGFEIIEENKKPLFPGYERRGFCQQEHDVSRLCRTCRNQQALPALRLAPVRKGPS